jgi:hypothetical protein
MLLTMREKTRIAAVQAIMDGRLSVAPQAATALNLSERLYPFDGDIMNGT